MPNNFSFSGIKTALLYKTKKMSDKEIKNNFHHLAASYQEVILNTLFNKLKFALEKYNVKNISIVGGVSANKRFRDKSKDFEQQHGDIVEDRKGISGILVEDDDDIGFFDEQGKWSKMLQVVGDKFKEFVSVDEMISPKDEPKKGSSNIPMPDDIAGVSDETEEYNFKDFFDNY